MNKTTSEIATIWIGPDEPIANHLGALWLDTNEENGYGILKYYNGVNWITISAIYS